MKLQLAINRTTNIQHSEIMAYTDKIVQEKIDDYHLLCTYDKQFIIIFEELKKYEINHAEYSIHVT